MLTHQQLVTLDRTLRTEPVLSVYVDGTATDVALQRAWRAQLANAADDLRRWLEGSTHAEREELDRCLEMLDDELAAFPVSVGAPGWAAFITARGVRYAETLPVPMPTLAVWSSGAYITPYLRALKEHRPVIVVLGDARKTTIFRYAAGSVNDAHTIHAYHVMEQVAHMGDAPRPGFHAGTRGDTGRDAAQRAMREGMRRMLDEAAVRVRHLAGDDGWIVLGGIPRVAAHLESRLGAVADRVLLAASLDVHATRAEVAATARAAASRLRDEHMARLVDTIAEHAEGNGPGAVGAVAVRAALTLGCVRELLLSHRYIEEHAASARDEVRAALDQGAIIEEVSHDAATRLDAMGGIAARLRFRPPETAAAAFTMAATEAAPPMRL